MVIFHNIWMLNVGNGWDWGLLGWLLLVMKWIIPENSRIVKRTSKQLDDHITGNKKNTVPETQLKRLMTPDILGLPPSPQVAGSFPATRWPSSTVADPCTGPAPATAPGRGSWRSSPTTRRPRWTKRGPIWRLDGFFQMDMAIPGDRYGNQVEPRIHGMNLGVLLCAMMQNDPKWFVNGIVDHWIYGLQHYYLVGGFKHEFYFPRYMGWPFPLTNSIIF